MKFDTNEFEVKLKNCETTQRESETIDRTRNKVYFAHFLAKIWDQNSAIEKKFVHAGKERTMGRMGWCYAKRMHTRDREFGAVIGWI